MPKLQTILAIETSADETSAAVCRGSYSKTELSANIIYSQINQHVKTGGIVPEVAARAHIPKVLPAIKLALKKSRLELADIDAVAVTAGPGLITSLRIGFETGKAIAFALHKPLLALNHLEGHLLSGMAGLSLQRSDKFLPGVGLIVSGGHTMLVEIKKIGRYRIIGETLDDAAGEAYDKTAKILGLPYPGGPAISRAALEGNPRAFKLPRPMLAQKNFDFSFAGLKTSVLYLWQGLADHSRKNQSNMAAGIQEAINEVLTSKTIEATRRFRAKSLHLGGGVSANRDLRAKLTAAAAQVKVPLFLPDLTLSTDNAGMMAVAGLYHRLLNDRPKTSAPDPNLTLKSWRKI